MSSYGLSSKTKKQVKSTVLGLRKLLEGKFDPDTGELIPPGGDVARQISRYGILVDKPESLKSENAPEYLTDAEKKKRERICASIKREVSIFGKLSEKAALRRGMRAFIRQTSYTWVNRLLGLRCMEARGLLKDDRGELDFVVTPSDDYGGLPRRAWRIKGKDPGRWQTAKLYDLQCEAIADACHQLTQEIKVLFDPEHDYGLIWPSPPALNTLLQKIQELDGIATPSPFTAPDFLGWVYQYFQTIEKDMVFEAASKKKRKIEKDDIIPATQIFTEHYMVEYLVQNSLGRFWMEMHPDSNLSAKWAYYVKPPEENSPVERELKKAIEIKMIDPALGSGHFHLVSFDLLLDMYEEEIQNAGQPGWPDTPSVKDKKDIPKAILEHNLFGIDIDARAVQLASLVLVMKARESGYEGPIDHLNLVVANSAPFESEAWHLFIQNLKKDGKHSVARVLAALGIQLKNLDEFGSLLRIEDEMQKIIQEEKKQWVAQAGRGPEQDYLFPEMTKPRQERLPFEKAITDETFFDRLGTVIQNELDSFYQRARDEGLAEEAIMAADAERGFDFARLSMLRYDVVYTNPPFLGSKKLGSELKGYLKNCYIGYHNDLYTTFIKRCLTFCTISGLMGIVCRDSWTYQKNYRRARKDVLDRYGIVSWAQIGASAFSEPLHSGVKICLLTFSHITEAEGTYHDVSNEKGVEAKANALKLSFRTSAFNSSRFSALPNNVFIPTAPVWVYNLIRDQSVLRIADLMPGTDGTVVINQFTRFHWEVPCNDYWLGYSKGGGFKRWSGLDFWVIDWTDEGGSIRDYALEKYPPAKLRLVIKDEHMARRQGLTYTSFANFNLGARELRSQHVSSNRGPCFVSNDSRICHRVLAFLNTHIANVLIRIVCPSIEFGFKYVSEMPIAKRIAESNEIESLSNICLDISRQIVTSDCRERYFDMAKFNSNSNDCVTLSENYTLAHFNLLKMTSILHSTEAIIELIVSRLLGLADADMEDIFSQTGKPVGLYPMLVGYDKCPEFRLSKYHITTSLLLFLESALRQKYTPQELAAIKIRLKRIYQGGPGTNNIEESEALLKKNKSQGDAGETIAIVPFLTIPSQTFVEELSRKLQIHPISIYLLLEEMLEKEGLVCPSEQKRHAEDYASVMILRMLGYQWPKQIEASEPLPEWVDDDGIIPLTEGLGEPTLLDRVRERFGADFGEEKEASIEAEFANIVGKPLERWLEEDFFGRHVKQFKNRPIAWHIISDPSVVNHEAGQSGKGKKKGAKKKQKPAFSVMVHYHRFVDGDKGYGKLLLLKNKYLEKLMTQTRSELESLRGKGDDFFDRIAELDRKLVELEDFRERLERIQEGKDRESRIFVRWKSSEEQPRGWCPDINDGVKINIAPWERLGMFPVKKIVGKVEMDSNQ